MSDARPTRIAEADIDPAMRALVSAAQAARERAHAPYSRFGVGAAVAAGDRIITGSNVEISSYGLTMCAERVALFTAVAAGHREFSAIAVVGPGLGDRPTPPCGACRQVIWDLAGDVRVLLVSPTGDVEVWQAADLLPAPFDPGHLNREPEESRS